MNCYKINIYEITMRNIPTSARGQIESRIEDVNLLLSSCNPFAAVWY